LPRRSDVLSGGGRDPHHEVERVSGSLSLCPSSDPGHIGAARRGIAREHARTARRNLDYVLAKDRGLMAQVPGLALVAD
jgi:hypothetical protein